MDIVIEAPYDPKRLEERRRLEWALLNKKGLFVLIAILVIGVLTSIFILPSTGIFLAIIGLLLIYRHFQNRKQFLSPVYYDCLSWQFPKGGFLNITNDFVSCASTEITFQIKWSVFTHYLIQDEFLFLVQKKISVYYLPIDLQLLSQKDRNDLLSFVTKSLIEN
jgi:hypothetical protein